MKEIFSNIWHSKRFLFVFELLYVAFGFIIVYPTLLEILNFAIKLSPYHIITSSNFINFVFSPTTILAFIIIAIIWAIYALFQYVSLSIFFDKRYKYTTLTHFLKTSLVYTSRIFHWKNIFLLLFLMLLVPTFSFIFTLIGFPSLQFPKVFQRVITNNFSYKMFFYFIVIILSIVTSLLFFVYHFFSVEKMYFIKASKNSLKLVQNNLKEIIKKLAIGNTLLIVSFLITYLLSILIVGAISNGLSGSEKGLSIFLSIMYVLNIFTKFVFKSFFFIINYAILTSVFNKHYASTIPIDKQIVHERHAVRKSFLVFFVVLMISTIISFCVSVHRGVLNTITGNDIIEITSHRGVTTDAPENSIPAFQAALEENIDYIELDLCHTSDNVVIVFHDKDLLRMTGHKINITDITFEELANYPIGEYAGKPVYIPSFEEVLIALEGKARLNIEIKSYSYDEAFLDKIYDLMDQYTLLNNSMISSTNRNILRYMKEKNDILKTGYIISYAYGDLINMSYVDFYSVNYQSLTAEFVENVHSKGKEVHAWTPNTNNSISDVISLNVDNIITDKPTKASNLVFYNYSDYVTKQIMKFFFTDELALK